MAGDRRLAPQPLLGGFLICAAALAATSPWPSSAMRGWLAAAVFCSSAPIGALVLALTMRLVGGAWRERLAAPLHALASLTPLAGLAFVPVLTGAGALYPWTREAQEGFRAAWLTEWSFAARTIVYFAALSALTWLPRRWPTSSTALACAGLIFVAAAGLPISVDWIASLDPRFHSSGFGLYVLSIQTTVGLAAAGLIAMTSGDRAAPPVYGALLLACVLGWAYFAFLHYFVLWSGDLPHGVRWYQRRLAGGWIAAPIVYSCLQLAAGSALLSSHVRRSRAALLAISIAVLAAKAVEVAWLIVPGTDRPVAALAVALAAAVGLALILSAAARLLASRRCARLREARV